MRILNRYLFNNLLKPLLYLIMAFTLLSIIGDLMDTMDKFYDAKTSFADIAYYYAVLRLPSMVILIIPLCLLLAVLYSLSTLTRHSEIIAMRASGISIYRIVRPYMLMGFICLVITTVVNEYAGPRFAYRADQFVDTQKYSDEDVYFEQIAFKNPEARHIWYIKEFDTRSYTMKGIELIQQRENGTDRTKYMVSKARWMDGRWWFEDGSVQEYDELGNREGKAEAFKIMEMRKLPEVPEDFMGEVKDPAYQSSTELWKYIQTHQQILSPATLVKYEVDFHHRLSMPVVCIIITMIGIPVGAHTGRKGAFAGIMLALGMFFAFYATQFSMEYLAKQMIILPWLGPWGAVIGFFIIGGTMIHRMR
ncbi:MAG: LptF/LptG family permease [Verrucomicrobiota bacterium]